MSKRILSCVVAILVAAGTMSSPSVLWAQSDMTVWFDQQVAQNNQYFQQLENGITQQNMQNPEIQRQYQAYAANGGSGSFQDYAFGWAATGGYTPTGWGVWNASESQIQRRDQQAISDYHNYTNNLWTETNNERRQVQDRMAYHRGELLSGNGTYVNPWNGSHHTLPYTSSTGTTHQDYYGHNQFQMDAFGNQWMQHPNTGLWYQMNRF
ncbi:MAG: hypothetical protein Q8M16_21690 [Pirellulaceae bacterium]|nr:hypothetical protein [Pirellulaceae bacterium]